MCIRDRLHHVGVRSNPLALARILLRRGADLSAKNCEGLDAEESNARHGNLEAANFLHDVKAAGGWKSYVRAPRVELVRLRLLCAQGRARPPSSKPILARLFGAPGTSKKSTRASKLASRPLPKEVFWHVLSYWRTIRDDYY